MWLVHGMAYSSRKMKSLLREPDTKSLDQIEIDLVNQREAKGGPSCDLIKDFRR